MGSVCARERSLDKQEGSGVQRYDTSDELHREMYACGTQLCSGSQAWARLPHLLYNTSSTNLTPVCAVLGPHGWDSSFCNCYRYSGVGYSQRWEPSESHPHLNNPTLLSFVYGPIAANGTYDVAGYSNGGQTNWVAGYYSHSSAQYLAQSRYDSSGFPARLSEEVVLGGMSSGKRSVHDFFKGSIYGVLLYKAKLNNTQRAVVESWMNDRYGLTCPPLVAANVTTRSSGSASACPAPAPNNQLCSQACDSGYQVGGPSDLKCSGGRWTGRKIACSQKCPRVASPIGYETCTKYYMWDQFNASTDPLAFYDTSPPLSETLMATYWSRSVEGWLDAKPPQLDDACSLLEPTALILNKPAWARPLGNNVPVVVEVDVMLVAGSARGGIVFRYLSDGDMYRFTISSNITTEGTMQFERILGGSITLVAPAISSLQPTLTTVTGVWHTLRVKAIDSSFQMYLNDTLVYNVTETSIPFGIGGMYAESGPIRFDNFRFSSICDESGAACRDLVSALARLPVLYAPH